MKVMDRARSWSIGWLYAGFVLTGFGTTLLGCLLPTLMISWRINDSRAGILFAAQFTGAALGATLVSRDLFNSILRGYILLIAGAASIAYFGNSPYVVLFFVFGLGLGLAMTASSMLMGSLFRTHRGSVLSILNACWCLGAVLCPVVASWWIRRLPAANLFFALAITALVVLVFLRRISPDSADAGFNVPAYSVRGSALAVILSFALIAFLYVGVEASVSGWMMAYVRRLTLVQNSWPPLTVSCFWIALLCGRAIAPVVLRPLSEDDLLTLCVAGAFASVLLLILNRTPVGIVLSAASAGLLLGPIYPLCLAKVLALSNDSPKTKWIFGTSGLGGALLPWLTGKRSADKRSLSLGLMVPLLALGIMLIQVVFVRKPPKFVPATGSALPIEPRT
jgi:fucose permease